MRFRRTVILISISCTTSCICLGQRKFVEVGVSLGVPQRALAYEESGQGGANAVTFSTPAYVYGPILGVVGPHFAAEVRGWLTSVHAKNQWVSPTNYGYDPIA